MKLKLTALVAGLAVVAASGCSSTDTKNDYVDTVNGIQASALDAFNAATTTTPQNTKELVEQLEAGATALEDAVAELEAVEVPEEAQDGHPKLVRGIDDLRQLFEDTAAAVAKGGTADAFAAVTELSTAGARIGSDIDQTISQINRDLGAL